MAVVSLVGVGGLRTEEGRRRLWDPCWLRQIDISDPAITFEIDNIEGPLMSDVLSNAWLERMAKGLLDHVKATHKVCYRCRC